MSITNPFNFGPSVGSIGNSSNRPEVSGRIIVIRKWRWKYKYGIGESNPLDPGVREYYDEYVDVGEPDEPWEPIGGGGSTLGGGGGGVNPFPGGIITGYDGKGRAPSVPIVPDKVPSWAMIDPSHPNPRKTPPKIRFIEDAHSAGVNPFTGETFTDSEKEAIRQAMDMYLYPEVQDLLSLFDGLLGYSSFSINLSGFFDSVYISKNRNTNSVKFNAHIAGIISLVMPQKSINTPADVFVSTFFAAILLMMLNDGSVDKKSAYLDAVAMTLFLIQILKSENKNISNNLINDLIKILDEIYNLAIKDGTSIIKGDFFVWDIVNGKLYLKDTMEELNIIGKWRR